MRFHAAYPAAAPAKITTPYFIETHPRLPHEQQRRGRCNDTVLGDNRLLSRDDAGRTVNVPMICGVIRGALRTMQSDAMPGDLPRETGS